jgi:MFS transporter, putative metabolite:H+ symporter
MDAVTAIESKRGDLLIQELPWRWAVQGKIFVICGLAILFDAWDVLMAGFLIPLLGRSDWHPNNTALGLFGSAGLIGMAFGAFFFGTTADIVGRKRSLILTLLTYSIFSIIGTASPNYASLIVFRFIAGLGLGGCIPIAYSSVAEFVPRAQRGMAVTAMNIWWPIGGTINGIVATALLPYDNWRLLPLAMILPIGLILWVIFTLPESPLYLMRCGRESEARAVIDDLIKRTGAKIGEWELPKPEASLPSFGTFFTHLGDVWKWNWRVTLAVWGMLVANLLLSYGVLTWLPGILVTSGYGMYRAYLFATWMNAVGIMATLVAAWLAGIWGRKWIIVVTGILAGIFMVLFTMYVTKVETAKWLLMSYAFTNLMVASTMYCYVPEVFPTLLRGTGFGWASTASRVAAGLVPVIFGAWLWPILGLTDTFIAILSLIVLTNLWLAYVGPETLGTRLE